MTPGNVLTVRNEYRAIIYIRVRYTDFLCSLDWNVYARLCCSEFFQVIVTWKRSLIDLYIFFRFATATGAAAGLFAILNHVRVLMSTFSSMTLFPQKPKIDSSAETGMRLRSVQGLIEFIDVDFSYPSRPGIKVNSVSHIFNSLLQILNSITFSVNSGETKALVGANGCEKSTLIQLLQRFYDPTAGRVYKKYSLLSNVMITFPSLGQIGWPRHSKIKFPMAATSDRRGQSGAHPL